MDCQTPSPMKKIGYFIVLLFLFSCGDDDAPSFDRDFIVDNIDGGYEFFSVQGVSSDPDAIPDTISSNGSILETTSCNTNLTITFTNGSFSIESGPYNTSGITSPECSSEENSTINETGDYFVQEDNPNISLAGITPNYLIFLRDIIIKENDSDYNNRKSLIFVLVGTNPEDIEYELNYIFLE